MKKRLLTAVFLLSSLFFTVHGQNIDQTLRTAIAGIRQDMSIVQAENRRLTLRVETLEEQCVTLEKRLQEMQRLCDAMTTQMQAAEKQRAEEQAKLVANLNAERQKLQTEFKKLGTDIRSVISDSNQASNANTNVPYTNFTVEAGDTLSSIAKAFGISVNELKQFNNLSSDIIRPKQVLRVPQK